MQFELTDDVINQIIFSMEDQSEQPVFDSVEKKTIEKRSLTSIDTDRYYDIPVWNSVDGFRVMEHFVCTLNSPIAKKDLCAVLFAGKGVFRNFKDTLKEYPAVENLWFAFKQKAMKKDIIRWYNVLRDSWGLERVEGEPEETDYLVFGDFIFREYDAHNDSEHVCVAEQSALQILENAYDGGLGSIVAQLWKAQKNTTLTEDAVTFICESNDGDFSGMITGAPVSSQAKTTAVVTTFFILPAWRGLGIGKELFLIFLEELKKRNICWVLVPDMFIPQTFYRVLLRSGFEKTDIGFVANLTDTQ
ncbi:MAG: UPF0158 family protein [Spirochaetales bacterium]